MWADLFAKSKENGLNVVDTYVFWDEHEAVRGTYDFTGNRDLIKFIKMAGEAGLYVNLRIGPYGMSLIRSLIHKDQITN